MKVARLIGNGNESDLPIPDRRDILYTSLDAFSELFDEARDFSQSETGGRNVGRGRNGHVEFGQSCLKVSCAW